MKGRAKLTCATCGATFVHDFGKAGGRPPKHCPAHRHATGPKRDVEGNRLRKNARRATKREGEAKAEVSADIHRVYELAAALSLFDDSETAARFVGLPVRGAELERLVDEARRSHGAVIEGDPAELSRRLLAAKHLCVAAIVRQRDQIAPRDHPHVMRAMAQVAELAGAGKQTRYAQVTLQVVGADGVPFDPTGTG